LPVVFYNKEILKMVTVGNSTALYLDFETLSFNLKLVKVHCFASSRGGGGGQHQFTTVSAVSGEALEDVPHGSAAAAAAAATSLVKLPRQEGLACFCHHNIVPNKSQLDFIHVLLCMYLEKKYTYATPLLSECRVITFYKQKLTRGKKPIPVRITTSR
jgi:hypothetical protein